MKRAKSSTKTTAKQALSNNALPKAAKLNIAKALPGQKTLSRQTAKVVPNTKEL